MRALLILMAMLFATQIACAQVPGHVLKAFEAKYPQLEGVTWEREGPYYQANFLIDGLEASDVLDGRGEWVSSSRIVKASDLPENLNRGVAEQFEGYTIEQAKCISEASGQQVYALKLKRGGDEIEAILDAEGQLLEDDDEVEEGGE